MRPNRKEPESAPFWFQSLSSYFRPHGDLLHVRPHGDLLHVRPHGGLLLVDVRDGLFAGRFVDGLDVIAADVVQLCFSQLPFGFEVGKP